MYSLMYKLVENAIEWQKIDRDADEFVEWLFVLLEEEIWKTGNYFTELVDIAILTKHLNTTEISHFRNTLKYKILQERGEEGLNLIKKFDIEQEQNSCKKS